MADEENALEHEISDEGRRESHDLRRESQTTGEGRRESHDQRRESQLSERRESQDQRRESKTSGEGRRESRDQRRESQVRQISEEDQDDVSSEPPEEANQHFDEADEGKRKMEESQQARLERQAQEMAEYEALRKVEREKEEEEIRALREKKEARKEKVLEEDRRLKELAAQEEMRRKQEDEERKRNKQEAERAKQEEKERKRREAEERLKPKKPNYVIQKRADGEKNPNVAAGPVVFGREDMQKSKEQLEEEKRSILAQRVHPLSLSGLDKKMLMDKAKELHDHLRKLTGDNYDLEEAMKRQHMDMLDLQERARQMNKGGKKNQAAVQVSEFDRLSDKFAGAPPRIELCSKYERHTDHRTYTERREIFRLEDRELEGLLDEPPPEGAPVAEES